MTGGGLLLERQVAVQVLEQGQHDRRGFVAGETGGCILSIGAGTA